MNNDPSRQMFLKAYNNYLKHNDMDLVPVGYVGRGPGWFLPTPDAPNAEPILYGGKHKNIGIVFSLGLRRGEEPDELLMNILRKIEGYAMVELSKVPDHVSQQETKQEAQ